MKTNIIDKMKSTPLVFDGAMGTVIYEKGVFVNACYDELNITNPKFIEDIHLEYLQAGADVILTNTFGANRVKLAKYGLSNKVVDINKAGVEIAKSALNKSQVTEAYILGCVGSVLNQGQVLTCENEKEIKESFVEQITALKESGVDGVIFETFSNPEELLLASSIAKGMGLATIACLTISKEMETLEGLNIKKAIKVLDDDKSIDAVGLNCSIGPLAMLSAIELVIPFVKKPLVVEPNAGSPQKVEGRMIYMNTPEYFSTYCQNYIRLGVSGVGGCCGTTPEHIGEMSKTVKALTGVKKHLEIEKIEVVDDSEIIVTPSIEKSNFARKLFSGEKVTSIEITPPRSVDLTPMLNKVRECKEQGVDAINIPDGPRASARISSMVAAIMIEREVGIETILHYCCRDRNLIGMQSDLLGGHAAGLKNYLVITGDPPKLGDYPNATAVFDVDAVGLTKVVNNLNKGRDIAGNLINPPVSILVGVGANPCAVDIDKELNHYLNKFNAGAEYAITQPVFDADALLRFLDKAEKMGINIPVLAGIWPLVSYRNATFLKSEVPGVEVPDSVIERMSKAKTKEDGVKIGIDIAREIREKISSSVAGYQISAPFGNVKIALDVLN